ncbi:MAG TPA: hypothetical protein VH206_17075 [Xanthobacteraceae bacterium]|jgi:hypothetical protein|nr:hypothetical protein [Xanthobacteraceae bacterium]
MFRITALTFAFALVVSTSALAQQFPAQPPPVKGPAGGDQGTSAERDACHPDVTKFCQTQLQVNPNDLLGILGCLQANRPKISAACNQVLASHGQ